jgi:hypothetical protein
MAFGGRQGEPYPEETPVKRIREHVGCPKPKDVSEGKASFTGENSEMPTKRASALRNALRLIKECHKFPPTVEDLEVASVSAWKEPKGRWGRERSVALFSM